MGDSLAFSCLRCGSTDFEIPEDPRDDDIVSCASCGAEGRYGDIRQKMVDLAKKHVDEMAAKALGPLFKKR